MLPDIILNKIYWYLWKINQKYLCIEHNQRVEWKENYNSTIVHSKNPTTKFCYFRQYNWRELHRWTSVYIIHIILPRYYFYSNGSIPDSK